ncbi:U-box domain-containing protein 43-like [Telopea speciosissima]|uniref:U-box domain-containing protein 43-like n=1 Tax=Telopea speciosissima TaxID=54955 RepID=UPI001CC48FB8|nr:U-box domain-containing protein 43-like [Telopea speciosissima]
MALELLPIGTVLAYLTTHIIKTAEAAKDVLIEKESFKVMSKYLFDIEPVLKELQLRKLNDSQTARQALAFLEEDVKKANYLVEKYKNRARFYLLIKCRSIVKEVQDVTRDIGRSLAALSLASTEVLLDISEKVNRLQNDMQRAEFEASQTQLRIVEKLDQGLKEQKVDQGFANDMLEEIAKAVGIPVEPSKITEELESFRREKEEAAARKERAEVFFLEQVIELLSRADAANDHETVKAVYIQRIQTIEKYETWGEYITPFNSFICPIAKAVMFDPVSICTGTTCERRAIEAWFECGERTDPDTGQPLDDFSLRSNLKLRQSIEEWRELNYCLKIRSARAKLLSGEDLSTEEALDQIQELIIESPINKDWVAIAGLIDIVVPILGSSHNRDVKRRILITLKAVTEEHTRNKDRVVESQGVEHLVPCLGRDPNTSMAAVELLLELLQDRSGWNVSVLRKLSQQSSAIIFLVTLLKGTVIESAEKAEKILLKLCDDDEENIARAAKANWYKPLINRLIQGPDSSRISMVKTLVNMELVDQNIALLGEEGVIPPLLEMVLGSVDCKNLALSALVKLSSCRENKRLIAAAGGVPLVLDQLFSSHVYTFIIEGCSKILERLSSNGHGIEFLTDSKGDCLDLEQIVANLLAFQQDPSLSHAIRKPVLRALLAICRSEAKPVEKAVASSSGVSIILPLLDDPDQEIRELALNLLSRFSIHEPQGIGDFLLMQPRVETLVHFLKDDSRSDAQMAAAGLIANLPKSEVALTTMLIESDALPALLHILISGTMEAKENALGALFRFTDPTNLGTQRMVVELGAYPLLLNFLKSDSITAKARAAALIGNFSSSSPKLTVVPRPYSWWCFRPAHVTVCVVHGGICSVKTTFCLLSANALPELVQLLQEKVNETAYEALQTLSTLVWEDASHRGAYALHEANAICPILEVLNWGPPSLKEEALSLLEKVFAMRELVELYKSQARMHLVRLTTRSIHEESQLGRKAARVLAQLDRYSKSSMPLA